MSITNSFKLIIALIIISAVNYWDLSSGHQRGNYLPKQPLYKYLVISFIEALNFSAKIAAIVKNRVENDHSRILQTSRNKTMHAKNGNRVKEKTKNHIKAMAINKGSSNLNTYKNLMINTINSNRPDVLVVSEANLKKTMKPLLLITLNTMSNPNS